MAVITIIIITVLVFDPPPARFSPQPVMVVRVSIWITNRPSPLFYRLPMYFSICKKLFSNSFV